MKYRKTAAGVIVGLGVATVGFASASLLNLDATTIQSGQDSVTSQVSTVQTNWGLEFDDNSVRFVRFSNFDSDVIGDKAFVRVLDNNGAEIAEGSFTIGGTATTDRIALPATTNPANIGSVLVTVAG